MGQRLNQWLESLDRVRLPRSLRFLLVGLSGVGVNNGALLALVDWAGLPLLVAAALAIETSIWNNFLLNDAWTFGRGPRLRPWWARALAFHATAALAAGINLGLLALLVSAAGLHYVVANLLAIALAAGVNYGLSTIWTWRPKPFSLPSTLKGGGETSGAKNVVVIPTYNEAANIRALIGRILALGPAYQVLVVDDNSPDGTGELVASLAAREPRIHLLQRANKMGLGTAYIAGFREALALGADLIFQMDADLSHFRGDLPRLAQAVREADVVIGSRYVRGGSTVGWPWSRRFMSASTNAACRFLLGLPVHDATGGFKCWRRQVLESLPLAQTHSTGFAFQIEMNYLAWQAGFRMVEVPVTFVDRRAGHSKMSLGIALEAALLILRLSLGSPQRYTLSAPQRGR